MTKLRWWLRIVGAFYVLQFVMVALVRAPIRAQSPDILPRAAGGDPVANFLIDTWVIFGLEMLAVGVGLLIAARYLSETRPLVWTIIAIEICRGLIADVYLLARGHDPTVPVVWIVLHTLVIVTALRALHAAERDPTPNLARYSRGPAPV